MAVDNLCSISDIYKKRSEAKLLELLGYYDEDIDDRVLDVDRINEAIVDSTAYIYGYLSGKYVVPFTVSTLPELTASWIKQCAVDIALHELYQSNENMPKTVEDDYNRWLKLLEAIQDGKSTLPGFNSGSTTSVVAKHLVDSNGYQPFKIDNILSGGKPWGSLS